MSIKVNGNKVSGFLGAVITAVTLLLVALVFLFIAVLLLLPLLIPIGLGVLIGMFAV